MIPSTLASTQIIQESDIVITRDSAIGFDAWFLNTPILFFLNGMLKGKGLTYIPDNYLGKFSKMPSLEDLSKNLGAIVSQFYSHKYQLYCKRDESYLIKKIANLD